jgi:hypothetical protein
MTPRLFTTGEVDALIPKLAELMGTALERHGQAQALAEAIRDAKERIRISGGPAPSASTGSPSRCARRWRRSRPSGAR